MHPNGHFWVILVSTKKAKIACGRPMFLKFKYMLYGCSRGLKINDRMLYLLNFPTPIVPINIGQIRAAKFSTFDLLVVTYFGLFQRKLFPPKQLSVMLWLHSEIFSFSGGAKICWFWVGMYKHRSNNFKISHEQQVQLSGDQWANLPKVVPTVNRTYPSATTLTRYLEKWWILCLQSSIFLLILMVDGGPPHFFRNKLPYVNPSFQRPLNSKKPVFFESPLFCSFQLQKYICIPLVSLP